MISLTMSRISSRAESASSLASWPRSMASISAPKMVPWFRSSYRNGAYRSRSVSAPADRPGRHCGCLTVRQDRRAETGRRKRRTSAWRQSRRRRRRRSRRQRSQRQIGGGGAGRDAGCGRSGDGVGLRGGTLANTNATPTDHRYDAVAVAPRTAATAGLNLFLGSMRPVSFCASWRSMSAVR